MVALPRRPAGTPPDTVPTYLLRAAVRTRRTVNGAGLMMRVGITLMVTASLACVNGPLMWWALPAWLGLALATMEWAERQLRQWLALLPAVIARVLRSVLDSSERVRATPAGVLEGLIGPVLMVAPFAGPLAVVMPHTLRVTGCALLALYVTSAAMQVVNDASLYNYRDRATMPRHTAWARALYPIWNSAVALAIFVSTDRAFLSVEQAVALSAIPLLIYPLMGLSDAAHLGSTHAYASSLQDTLDFVRAGYASDIHLLKSAIRARALFTSTETKAALQDVFLQTELIRLLAVEGRYLANIEDAVAAVRVVVRERSPLADVNYEIDGDTGVETVDPVGLELLERILLDCVDNAVKASGGAIRISIRGQNMHDNRFEVVVVIADEGPGYEVPDEFAFGSSMRQLQRQCVALNGVLSVESSSAGTCVTASFVVPRVAVGQESADGS